MNEVWNSGPPPSVGWWPASREGQRGFYRWWDGMCWSGPTTRISTAETAARVAACPALNQRGICWLPRPKSWPARSHT